MNDDDKTGAGAIIVLLPSLQIAVYCILYTSKQTNLVRKVFMACNNNTLHLAS